MHGNKLVQYLRMKKLMTYLMLSCRKATELIEKRISFSLNPMEKTQLFLHTSMCKACSTYEKQSKSLYQILYKFLGREEKPREHPVHTPASDDLKKKIICDLEK